MNIVSPSEQTSNPPSKKWLKVLLLFFLLIVMSLSFAFGFLVLKISKESDALSANIQEKEKKYANENYENKTLIEGAGNYWTGATNPKIIIVEFADYSCPKCKSSYPTIKQILNKYGNLVKLIYRDYPVISDSSMDLAHAARCAGEQGLYWQMHDKLFENQPIADTETIKKLAEQIGANMIQFNDCAAKSKYLVAIQKNFADATTLNVAGTPTWYINGHRIEGDIPLAAFEEIISKLQ